MEYITHSVEETENLASKLAKKLKGTEVIAFFGGLGMGKTAFTRGLCKGLNYFDGVQSPTFSLVNQYNADYTVYHLDSICTKRSVSEKSMATRKSTSVSLRARRSHQPSLTVASAPRGKRSASAAGNCSTAWPCRSVTVRGVCRKHQ